jgi:hypothetical protein
MTIQFQNSCTFLYDGWKKQKAVISTYSLLVTLYPSLV